MVWLVLDIARIITNIGWVSLFLLVFFIGYRLLLKRMKAGRANPADFVTLHPLEKIPARGKIQFYFSLGAPKEVTILIYASVGEYREELVSKNFSKGSHLISFDTQKVVDGIYYYELKTNNQKISRVMEIKNLS